MDIERQNFLKECDPTTELESVGVTNIKYIGTKEGFQQVAAAAVSRFNNIQKEGKLKMFRAFILGTVGGKDIFEVKFSKSLEGETLEQHMLRLGMKPREN